MLSEPILNFSTNFHIILGVMMLGHLEKFTNNFFLHKYHLKLLSRNFRKRGGDGRGTPEGRIFYSLLL